MPCNEGIKLRNEMRENDVELVLNGLDGIPERFNQDEGDNGNQYNANRAREHFANHGGDGLVDCQCFQQRFLGQRTEDEAENHRSPAELETVHQVTDKTENQHNINVFLESSNMKISGK